MVNDGYLRRPCIAVWSACNLFMYYYVTDPMRPTSYTFEQQVQMMKLFFDSLTFVG